MTTLPPPDSFFDGGKPQSSVAPGDTGRELMHDVRNLTQAVSLLRVVVDKQRARQRQIVIAATLATLAVLGLLAYTRYLAVETTRDRLVSQHEACQSDNARGDLEIEILEASAAVNADDPRATAFFMPRIEKFKALQKDCDRLHPRRPSDPGYPSFFGGS